MMANSKVPNKWAKVKYIQLMEITTWVVLMEKKCTEKVCSHGQMVKSTMASTSMTKRLDKELSIGLMEESMMEGGQMVSNTELDNTLARKANLREVLGKMARD